MTNLASNRFGVSVAALATAILLVVPATAFADPCEVADVGGTVELPPIGCDYLSPDEVHMIVDGLPPGTTIELAPIHKDFLCDSAYAATCSLTIPPGQCEVPGGTLGGNGDCFESTLQFTATGTGDLTGFVRTLSVPVSTEIHTGPRTPGDPVQTFPTEIVALEGAIFGDPDFDQLHIRAGSAFGLPSPGETTLTKKTNGNWNVDSFFDIAYTIDFVGAPGSVLDGLSGSTQATIRMSAGDNPCKVPEGPPGTVTLPPAGCQYLSPTDVHMILDGLPPGTTVELAAIHKDFICRGGQADAACSVSMPAGACETPGGTLSGSVDCFDSVAELAVTGTGALGGYQRTIQVPLATEVHSGPRTPGQAVQDFDTEMVQLQGQLFGDPDFDILRIRAGSGFGLPSPGHTTLTDLGTGQFQVDSFFDIAYTIDFQGAPGSVLEGLAGSTQGTIRMETGNPQAQQPPAPQLPALSGMWLVVFGALLAVSGTFLALRRREEAR